MHPAPADAPPLRRGELLASGAVAALGCALGVAADVATGMAPDVVFEPGNPYALDVRRIAPLLLAKSPGELLAGHYLAVFGIPLGLAGLWQVHRGLLSGSRVLARAFLGCGVLATVLGTVYHATFAFVAHFLRLRAELVDAAPQTATAFADALPALLALHEPLGRLLVLAMIVVSLLYAVAVGRGGTAYPRSLALANPITLQLLIAGIATLAPRPYDQLLFVTAFNASLLVFYAVSTESLWRTGYGSSSFSA